MLPRRRDVRRHAGLSLTPGRLGGRLRLVWVVVAANVAATVIQTVISFGIPQALVPLAWLTGGEDVMGEFRTPLRVSPPVRRVVLPIAALNVLPLLQVFGL